MKAKCDKCNEKLRKDVNRTKEQKKLILYCPLCKRNYTAQSAFHVYKTPKSEKIKKAKEKKADEIIENAKKEASEIIQGATQRANNLVKKYLEDYASGVNNPLVDEIRKQYFIKLDNCLSGDVWSGIIQINNWAKKELEMIEKYDLKVKPDLFIKIQQLLDDCVHDGLFK